MGWLLTIEYIPELIYTRCFHFSSEVEAQFSLLLLENNTLLF